MTESVKGSSRQGLIENPKIIQESECSKYVTVMGLLELLIESPAKRKINEEKMTRLKEGNQRLQGHVGRAYS